jgi:uncharacterized protein (DUF952 family)
MSVLFHIATGRDWERATSTGTYTTESMRSDGIIGCFSPAQHAAAANNLYAGRTDLVLLLIDTDRLDSEVRFEGADAHGQPVPCVDGPVNLDAVFEATPYRPGADGRFHPHEEASGLAVHGAATLDQTRRRAVEVMAGYRHPWWVAGGWDLRLAAPGQALPRWDGSPIESPFHQVWARRGPGRPATAEEFAADPTMLGFLLEQSRTDRWVFRRHSGVSRPLHQVGVITTGGVPVVAPEIALLFKAKAPRFKDQRDFDRVLPHLDRAARGWLASAWSGPIPATLGMPGCSGRRHDRDLRPRLPAGHDVRPFPCQAGHPALGGPRFVPTLRTSASWPPPSSSSCTWPRSILVAMGPRLRTGGRRRGSWRAAAGWRGPRP